MVGDWPDRDVVGAKKIGMRTALRVMEILSVKVSELIGT